ncbi:peptide ABC transporter substrate-binding protein [Blastococcus sp. SYSU DS0533]
MKLSKRRGGFVAAGVVAAMMLSACGGSDDNGGEGGTAAEGGGSFSVYVGEPENALIPGNTTESEGHQVISSLWTGLIEYAADGAVEYTGVAESIESEDNTTWTVTLKDGWTFHDGTPVTAQSFVDAWNYTAYSPNAQGASYFFSNILGYDDLQAPTDDEGNVTGDPAAQEMSGLRVIDETTFEVELASPFAQFPVTVGYNAFWPLPEAFFEDPEGFGTQPIGNGPFQADGEFVPGQGITVSRYEDYAGEDPANAETVEFRVYADLNTGYNDLQAGNLDVLPDLPPDALASAEDVLGDRYLEAPSSGFTYLGYPTYDERFSDPRVRQALSMAIDRQAISDAIFNGSRTPADAYVAPVVDGYREGACEYCELDVDAANALLDEAGFDRSQPIELWFNAGAGHDAWVQAVGNQLRENLGVDYVLRGELDFAEYLPLLDEQGVTGPFRLGWSMDYPSPQNYLEPLYSTAALPPAGSNATFYSNPEFDELIQQGNSASSNDEALDFYNQAEDILLQDMPIIPMFFDLEQAGHSENVSDVVIDVFGDIDVANVVPVS